MTENSVSQNVTTGFVYLIITTVCTLRCKYCTIAIPQHQPKHIDKYVIFDEIRNLFEIYDHIDRLIIQGGEAFLHPEINEIITESLKYKEKIGHLMFITNGTYVPMKSILERLQTLPMKYVVRIDDYGVNSMKIDDISVEFDKYGIIYDIRCYNDKDQYCNGWVDVLGGYKYHDYSNEELTKVFINCLNRVNCRFVWGGKLWGCGMQGSGVLLGKVPDTHGDSIDLLSVGGETITEKQQLARMLGSKPYGGCQYCNGFDVENSPRILAAEQL